jgi:acyl-CoA synthetase (AMP-forming)/AMP-acid ligase II
MGRSPDTEHALDAGRARSATLLSRLCERGVRQGDAVGFEFWRSGRPVDQVTYHELLEAAWGLAQCCLAVDDPQSEPVVLMYPPGREYLSALYGCLAARRPVIPAHPPSAFNREISLRRLRSIISDSAATTLLCPSPVLRALMDARVQLPDQAIGLEDWPRRPPTGELAVRADDVAIVQYTSGSTSNPKGVIVTHGNLDANLAAIQEAFALDRRTRAVLWLPPYHDMGLVGGLLAPLYVGFPIRLMSPWEFLKNPMSWLRNVSEFRATASGGPNFAYELCARRATDEQLSGLDLSTWRLAFNGAERVSRSTLEAFSTRFAVAGFDRSAWQPCYGLAESTVLVSASAWDGSVVDQRTRRRLVGAAQAGSETGSLPVLIGCGREAPGHDVLVVDPERLGPVPDGREGELWVAGPSVSPGYWRRPELTAAAFVERDGRRYLRTGDLGFRADGELVVSGRLREIVVRHGVNVHAEDIEQAAVEADRELRPLAAAFAVDLPDRSLAVLVVESASRTADVDALAARVLTAVLAVTGLALDAVVVAPPGRVPRTSSGKAERWRCRERYLAGDYEPWTRAGAALTGTPAAGDTPASAPPGPLTAASGADAPVTGLLAELVGGVFAGVCGVERCGVTTSLLALGADSIKAAEIAVVLEHALALPVSVESVLRALTPHRLAEEIVDGCRASSIGLRDLEVRIERTLAGQAS